MSGETVDIRENARFDSAALERWMEANVAGFRGPLTISQFAGGQSNPTFKLESPGGKYVMRRKPPGKLLKGAHAVDREARVIAALSKAGFPVPYVHALCTDDSVIGSWFYVMDMLEGRIFWDGTFADQPKADRAAYMDAMNSTQAQLHTYDPVAIGLGDYGKHEAYFARQLKVWTRQYHADEDAGRYEDLDFLVEWLADNIPPDGRTSVVHGDYRCDNMVFHPTRPEVIGVLDWELSTLGDPLVDFCYHLMMYRVPSGIPWGLAGHDLAELGLPREEDYIASYCQRMGIASPPDLKPYLALNLFRFAAIVHGIKGRMLRGNASNDGAADMVPYIDIFARIGREVAQA